MFISKKLYIDYNFKYLKKLFKIINLGTTLIFRLNRTVLN